MSHPILALQRALVAALRTAGLTVFDAPPAGQAPPYVTIARHDVLPRDGDGAPGFEHRLLLHVWAVDASRKAVVAIAETIAGVTLTGTLTVSGFALTLRRQDRTDTAIDAETGRARAAIALTFFTEPL